MKPASPSSLAAVLREARGGFLWVGVFSFCINVLVLTSPMYMMQIYDRVIASGRLETLFFLTLIAGIAIVVLALLEVVRGRMLSRISRWLEQRLAPSLISSSMRSALIGASVSAQPLRDLSQIRQFLSSAGATAIFDLPWAPLFIVIIWTLHPVLGMIALGSAVVLAVMAYINEYLSRQPIKDSIAISIRNQRRVDTAVANAEVFHSMSMLPGFLHTWNHSNATALDRQLEGNDRNSLLLGLTKFARIFIQILILGVGAYLVIKMELTSGAMIAASILLGRALAPIEQSIGAWKGFIAARESYSRIEALLRAFPARPTGMEMPAPQGRLTCENVIYVPRGRDKAILQGVSFHLEPAEALGVIGPSASGKSTLCRLLVGAWSPTRGHVRLDGADVTQCLSDEFGRHLGYLPQDVELFAGTVRDNIARLRTDADPEDIIAAAKVAGVHDMILRLPQGYDTEIGESGSFLSGGQRQRIGLARALFGRPKLIVLDEPNASLDAEGEESLISAIARAKAWGATVVLVAHQPRILRPVDKLLVLRDGRGEMFGKRDEVLAKLKGPVRAAPDGRPRVIQGGADSTPLPTRS